MPFARFPSAAAISSMILFGLCVPSAAYTLGLSKARSPAVGAVCMQIEVPPLPEEDDAPEANGDFVATLLDAETGTTLKCRIAGTVVVEIPGDENEDEVYGALYPVDTPITLARMEDDELVPLPETDERALFSMAEQACKDIDVLLMNTPVLLTAETTPEMMIDADDLEDADNEHGDDGDDDDDEAEEAMVLTAFEHEGTEIYVMKPLEQMFLVGKQTSDASIFVVPTTEEIDVVSPLVEELLQNIEEEEEE